MLHTLRARLTAALIGLVAGVSIAAGAVPSGSALADGSAPPLSSPGTGDSHNTCGGYSWDGCSVHPR